MDKTTNNILVGLGIALGVGGAFLLGKSMNAAAAEEEGKIDDLAKELLIKDPNISDEQAKAEAAAILAAEALRKAQEAGLREHLAELAAELQRKEDALAAAEQLAILTQQQADIDAAAQALADAEALREENRLEALATLKTIEDSLLVAQANANIAYNNYLAAKRLTDKQEVAIATLESKIPPIEDQIEKNNAAIVKAEARIQEYYDGGYWPWEHTPVEALQNAIASYKVANATLEASIKRLEGQISVAKTTLTNYIRAESDVADKSYSAIASSNNLIAMQISQIADIRQDGFADKEASRIDGLARTVQIKLGELEAKIEG